MNVIPVQSSPVAKPAAAEPANLSADSLSSEFSGKLSTPGNVQVGAPAGPQIGNAADRSTQLSPGFDSFNRYEALCKRCSDFAADPTNLHDQAGLAKMMALQGEMQRAQLEVNLISKVVEQATDGAKTLLQTQA